MENPEDDCRDRSRVETTARAYQKNTWSWISDATNKNIVTGFYTLISLFLKEGFIIANIGLSVQMIKLLEYLHEVWKLCRTLLLEHYEFGCLTSPFAHSL